jgi:regulator of nonsense transcripts 2
MGPTEEADAEFAKELAKMVTDTSAEGRKVDKKTALALWDSSVLPPVLKKRGDADEENQADSSVTKFMVLAKKGNKQVVRAVP